MTEDRATAPSEDPGPSPAVEAVTLTVIAYATGYQTLVRVSAHAPAHTLVGELGGPVGVSQVSNLLLTDRTPIPPSATLASLGVGDGTIVFVVGVYDTQPEPPGSEEDASVAADAEPAPAPAPAPDQSPSDPVVAGEVPETSESAPGGEADGDTTVGEIVWGEVSTPDIEPVRPVRAPSSASIYGANPESHPSRAAPEFGVRGAGEREGGPGGGEREGGQGGGEPGANDLGGGESEAAGLEVADLGSGDLADGDLADGDPGSGDLGDGDPGSGEAADLGVVATPEAAPGTDPHATKSSGAPGEGPLSESGTAPAADPELAAPDDQHARSEEPPDAEPDLAAGADPAGASDPPAGASSTGGATGSTGSTAVPDSLRAMAKPVNVAVAAATAVALLAIGLVIGRATDSTTSPIPSPAALAAARGAARSWLDATPYAPATVATGATPQRGRAGKVAGTLQLVGSSMRDGRGAAWFLLAPAAGGAVGLTVPLQGAKVADAPTVSPVPFGGGQLPPTATLTGTTTATAAQAAVLRSWASRTLGRDSLLTSKLDLGFAGTPRIVGVGPVAGGGAVIRVRLNLASTAPGTAGAAAGAALARAGAKVHADQAVVAHDQQNLRRDGSALATDATTATKDASKVDAATGAVNKASAANDAAGQNLAGVTAAANVANAANAAAAANPPTPPATSAPPTPVPDVGPAQAASAAAAQALAAAHTQQTADQAQQAKDQALQAKDRARQTSDQGALTHDRADVTADQAAQKAAQAKVPPTRSAVGTYDVWVAGGRVKGWVPAAYDGR